MEKILKKIDAFPAFLKTRIIGQENIINKFSERVRYAELGIYNHSRPKACFFLLGPTGTGKTELIRETMRYFTGNCDESLLRIDMSELGRASGEDVGKRLIGYTRDEPGRLYDYLERTRGKGGAILYDEFEKADRSVCTYMLQQIDAGRVTLWNNVTYDLSRYYLFFTSNIAAEVFQGNEHLSAQRKVDAALERLKRMFSPEFVARFGKFGYGIFAFNSLRPEDLRQICRKFIDDTLDSLRTIQEDSIRRGDEVTPVNMHIYGYTPDVVEFVLQQADTTRNGAREIRDIVERAVYSAYDVEISKNPRCDSIRGYLSMERRDENGKGVLKVSMTKPDDVIMCGTASGRVRENAVSPALPEK